MAKLSIHIFENVMDEDKFVETRFHKSIMLMRTVNPNQDVSREVVFAVYEIGSTRNYAAVISNEPISISLYQSMNLEPVRIWRLIRRKQNVFFVGQCSESIIAADVVPLGIRVEGGKDAERCWETN